jgi:hypothetical protein
MIRLRCAWENMSMVLVATGNWQLATETATATAITKLPQQCFLLLAVYLVQ